MKTISWLGVGGGGHHNMRKVEKPFARASLPCRESREVELRQDTVTKTSEQNSSFLNPEENSKAQASVVTSSNR